MQRNSSNRGITRCDCLLVHAWDCATGVEVQFWMTAKDAKTLGDNKFSFKPTNPDDPLYGENECYCLFFAPNLTYTDRASSFETPDFHHTVAASIHTPSEVIVQPATGGFYYTPDVDTSTTPYGLCGYLRNDGDLVDDQIGCIACANDCIHRVPCNQYLVAFHLKAEVWQPLFVGGDGSGYIPNPHGCLGDGTAAVDSGGENDFSFLTTRSTTNTDTWSFSLSDICGNRSADDDIQWVTVSPDLPGWTGDAQVQCYETWIDAMCEADVLLIHVDLLGSGTQPTIQLSRTRAADISGAYPNLTACYQIDPQGTAVRLTLTAASVTCAEGI